MTIRVALAAIGGVCLYIVAFGDAANTSRQEFAEKVLVAIAFTGVGFITGQRTSDHK